MAFEVLVSRDSDLPLGTQLAWQLKTLIATGGLAADERLPGARELGASAGVNVNTVRAVYRRLEDEGYLRSEHGRGTFVANNPPIGEELARIATAAADQARIAGVDLRDLAVALFVAGGPLQRELSGPDGPPTESPGDDTPPSADAPDRRRRLRAEILTLEGELAYAEQLTSSPRRRGRERAGRLLSATELETVRDQLRERLVALRSARQELVDASARAKAEADAVAGRAQQPPGRVWRHAGVSTRGVRPRTARVVWTAS